MTVSKIGRRGQMTLPREVRDWLNVRAGDRVAFLRRGDEIVLQPLTHSLLDVRGSVRVDGPQDLDAVRAAVKRRRGEQLGDRDG
jgi:AbrB family looped-hinge helix DNA binding protein